LICLAISITRRNIKKTLYSDQFWVGMQVKDKTLLWENCGAAGNVLDNEDLSSSDGCIAMKNTDLLPMDCTDAKQFLCKASELSMIVLSVYIYIYLTSIRASLFNKYRKYYMIVKIKGLAHLAAI